MNHYWHYTDGILNLLLIHQENFYKEVFQNCSNILKFQIRLQHLEVRKLFNMLLIIPTVSLSVKHPFIDLKQVQTYLCSMQTEEKLIKLSLMTTEKKNILQDLGRSVNFCDSVTDIFIVIIYAWKWNTEYNRGKINSHLPCFLSLYFLPVLFLNLLINCQCPSKIYFLSILISFFLPYWLPTPFYLSVLLSYVGGWVTLKWILER